MGLLGPRFKFRQYTCNSKQDKSDNVCVPDSLDYVLSNDEDIQNQLSASHLFMSE